MTIVHSIMELMADDWLERFEPGSSEWSDAQVIRSWLDSYKGTSVIPAQVWSDERISTYASNSPTAWEATRVYAAMRKVRDDCEKVLALQMVANDKLVKELADAHESLQAFADAATAEDGLFFHDSRDDDPSYLGSTKWNGWKVDLHDESEDE